MPDGPRRPTPQVPARPPRQGPQRRSLVRPVRIPGQGATRDTVEEVSAGGIVVDVVRGRALAAVIARLNRGGKVEWCLPKGHLEAGETAEQAAVREIQEETGISGRVLRSLGSIDYWFSVQDKRIHKTVHHYLLEATGGELSVEGDPDAEAVEAAWVPIVDLDERLTFVNERRIARAAGELLADTA